MDINAKRQERSNLAKQARTILDEAQADGGRDLTAEESTKFDRLMEQVDAVDAAIGREEKLRERERNIDAAPDQPREDNRPDGGGGEAGARDAAWRQYLTYGRSGLSPEQARALNVGSDPEGGYLVAPTQWVTDLLKGMDDDVPLRGLATVQQLTEAESLGVPTLDTDLTDAEWTSEIGTGSTDDSLRFGKRELTPNPLAKRVKVSRKLLRLTAGRAENIVRDRLRYKFAVSQEKAFMTGDGNKKPLGLFTASAMGIPTGRDVNSGSDTGFTGDGLIDAKYTLKAAYWRRARWLFHRDALKGIRKLKTSTDEQYVWQPGLASDRPDTILDVPYVVSEWVPNTFTENLYGGMIADFSYYWIADALDMEVQRLVELYAEANQVGFIGRLETDAMPVLAEAFVRIKISDGS